MYTLLLLIATVVATPLVPLPGPKPIVPAPNPNLPDWVTDLPRPTGDASHCGLPRGDCPAVVGYDCSGGCCGLGRQACDKGGKCILTVDGYRCCPKGNSACDGSAL